MAQLKPDRSQEDTTCPSTHQFSPVMERPLRTIFFFIVMLAINLGVQIPAAAAPVSDEKNASEPLFYTIQVGSFTNEEDAISCYNRLAEQLPAGLRLYLRVESIPPFKTVRIGKAAERPATIELLEEIQKITKKTPAIIHGYYRSARILKLYDPTAASEKPSANADTQKKYPAEEPLNTRPDAKDGPLPDRPEEPLDTPLEGKGSSPAPPSRRSAPTKVASQKPSMVQIPDAALKKKIIDKYLASQAADPKAVEALIKQSQSFPASPTCVSAECHADVKTFTHQHSPAQTDRCLACHKQINQKHPEATTVDFQSVATGAELCNQCHPKFKGKKYNHEPAAKGECLECHKPHGADNQFFLKVEASSQEKLCLKCHADQVVAKKFTHGPVGLGACTYCHNPHESDHQALLKDEPQTLCFACHTDIARGVKESASVHDVVKTEGCGTCHLPHGSDFPSLLKQSGEEFCFTCHPTIEDKFKKSKSQHAGLYLEKECGTCHQPHYSAYEKLLNSKELDLCLTCHSEKNSITSKSPKDIEIELKKTFIHGPITKGQCSVCHDPHGSKFLKLLSGPYPEAIYAPYTPEIYDLCFTCHDKELLTSQDTGSATAFRNGPQNLHYLHAAIPEKGRTCRTCHEAHSSNGPKLINQTGSSFGEWQMSISFETTGSGGSCMPGCHRKMEYSRDKAANNSGKDADFGTYHVEYESVK